jgi:PAS domain S-box-containing protein
MYKKFDLYPGEKLLDSKFTDEYFNSQEEELRKKTEQLDFLVNTNPGIIYRTTISNFNTIFISNNVYDILGYTARQFTENNSFFLSLVHPEDRERLESMFPSFLEKGFINAEYRCLASNGKYIWMSDTAKLIKDKNGNPDEITGYWLDITKRKEMEIELETTNSQFKNIFDNLEEAYFSMDMVTNKTLTISPSFEKMYGVPKKVHFENPNYWFERVHPDDTEMIKQSFPVLFKGGVVTNKYRIIREDGEMRWLDVRISPFLDINTNLLRIDGVATDITEKKLAEEKMVEQASMLDITLDAIIVTDLNEKIVFWNKGAEKIYGYSKEEATGKVITELLYYEQTEYLNVINKVLEKGEWQGEIKQKNKDDLAVISDSRVTIMRDKSGKPQSILTSSTDITNKKSLEAQLSRIHRMEGLGTLAGGIAHDLNNAITPIMMSVEILEMKHNDEKSRKLLNSIKESAKQSAALVKQILTFSSGIEGKKESLDLSNLVLESLNIIKGSITKTISINNEISDNIYNITGDLTQLNQVIINLIINSRDAMPNGGKINISAKNVHIDEAFTKMNIEASIGNYVMLTISDTGKGIPDKIVDRIFEPFFTTKEIGKGTGLGLSTILGIIRSHGGFITVSSSENKGTVFTIYLPAIARETNNGDTGENIVSLNGNGEYILVVDDEEPIREALETTLSQFNYNVMTAADGAEAIVVFLQNPDKIKVVITDMSMPVMDGIATIQALRKINPDIKIIASSGQKKRAEIINQAGKELKFLSKPYMTSDLLKAIQE